MYHWSPPTTLDTPLEQFADAHFIRLTLPSLLVAMAMTDQRVQSSGSVRMAFNIFECGHCSACSSTPSRPNCRHPGDSLEGQVVISSKSSLDFDRIEVLWQGSHSVVVPVYSWEYDKFKIAPASQSPTGSLTMLRAKNVFVSISDIVPLDSIREHQDQNDLKQYTFPFSFIIPHAFDDPDDKKPMLCCMLPPSFEATTPEGPVPWHKASPPCLSTTYRLQARIRCRETVGEDSGPWRRLEANETINIIPYSHPEPPTHTQDFPGEFVLSATTAVAKRAFGSRLGSLVISATEPRPLASSLLSSSPDAATECTISIVISARASSSAPPAYLRETSFRVQSAIRTKTFYSLQPMPCMPRKTDLAGNTLVRLHDDAINLAEKYFSNLGWEQSPEQVGEIKDDVRSDSSCHSRASASSLFGLRNSWGSTQATRKTSRDERHHHGSWRAVLKLKIEPPVPLVPAFCGHLIARTYSLTIRLHVGGGLHGKSSNLELPLQVVYPQTRLADWSAAPPGAPLEQLSPNSSPRCEGPSALLEREDVNMSRNKILSIFTEHDTHENPQTLPAYH